MKIRYKSDEKGRYVEEVKIYDSKSGLSIFSKRIDPSALHILERLKEGGFGKSYLVGGCVRDLLLDLNPKDFDIATEARPQQIKMIFGKKAVVIGRRFRLVHVQTIGKNYIEVVTFRTSREKSLGNNCYGLIEEDVQRRDFTINALYYDPLKKELFDYIGGMNSLSHKRIDPVIPVKLIFKEDPVRMIRLLKYAAKTNFKIPLRLRWQIFLDKKELKKIPKARLMDEILKILHSGNSRKVFHWLLRYNLLSIISPNLALQLKGSVYKELFDKELAKLDSKVCCSMSDLSKEDYMRPLRQLGKLIERNKTTTLRDSVNKPFSSYKEDFQSKLKENQETKTQIDIILEELLAPIQFTGEWDHALKNSNYFSNKKIDILKSSLSTQKSSKLSSSKKKKKSSAKSSKNKSKLNQRPFS